MLGYQHRLVAVDERLEPPQMRPVERLRTADRHTDAVQRDRVILTDPRERGMGRTASAHVVLGMHFKETISLPVGQDRLQMFVLEARAGRARNGVSRKAGCCRRSPG